MERSQGSPLLFSSGVIKYMSKRLSDIETSCRHFDEAIKYLKYLLEEVESYKQSGEIVDEWLVKKVSDYIKNAEYSIEIGRDINGQLRDTCSDIADEKQKEINELESRIEDLEKDHEEEIDKLNNKIEELEDLLPTQPQE